MVTNPYPSGGFNTFVSNSPTTYPIRFGQGYGTTTGDNSQTQLDNARSLFLRMYGGHLLESFYQEQTLMGLNPEMMVTNGKSFSFPRTGIMDAEYHTAGEELTGNNLPTGEVVITADAILATSATFYDLDNALSHFSIHEPTAHAMGQAMANISDRNKFRQLIRAARETKTHVNDNFPTGKVFGVGYGAAGADTRSKLSRFTSRDPTTGAWYDGFEYITELREISRHIYNNNLPVGMMKHVFVDVEVFDAIKYAYKANAGFIVLNRDYPSHTAGGISGDELSIQINDMVIRPAFNLVSNDETDTYIKDKSGVAVRGNDTVGGTANRVGNRVFPKYRGNYSNTKAVIFCMGAIATLKYRSVMFETTRQSERIQDFMVAHMLEGHGTLRREFAFELSDYNFDTKANYDKWEAFTAGTATDNPDTEFRVTNYTAPAGLTPFKRS